MLADAIRSEGYRFTKNRMAVFWSVVFAPVAILAISVMGNMFLHDQTGRLQGLPPELLTAGGPLDIGQAMATNAGDMANPIIMLFLLTGAAILYAGDYRWETWRLTSARNTRPNLVLGKVAVLIGVALAVMVVTVVADLIGEFAKAAIFERPTTFTFDGETAARFLGLAGLSLWRMVQFTMIALLAASLTRSLLAALFVPLVVAAGQLALTQVWPLTGFGPDSWAAMLALPGSAYDMLKAAVDGEPGLTAMADDIVWKAAIGLALWTLVPLVAAIAWFNRQDLSKE